ncbi:hypothetical protein [Paenibacillus herberti]|nr:hypothetical protein [Paenibacillus herberti]
MIICEEIERELLALGIPIAELDVEISKLEQELAFYLGGHDHATTQCE